MEHEGHYNTAKMNEVVVVIVSQQCIMPIMN